MAKRDRSAEQLDAIVSLRNEPDLAIVIGALRDALTAKSGVVVARAAKLVEERNIDALASEMTAAFARFLNDPVKTDPTCAAKTAIVSAGVATDCLDADVYLRAIRHIQMEGSFGPPIDTAAMMRGHAAFGLLNCRHPDALREIVELLYDADDKGEITDARRGGIRALGTIAGESSAVMLRMTAKRYADCPDTLGEVFGSLNGIEAGKSFAFIRSFLDHADVAVVDTAALAIGESRQPSAADVLLDLWPRRRGMDTEFKAFFTAVSLTRKPAAIEFLVDRIANDRIAEAVEAIEAIVLHRSDDALRHRVLNVVTGRGNAALERAANCLR